MRAISTFSFDAGRSTRGWRDPTALRIRVSMSAIGSVMFLNLSSVISSQLPVQRARDSPSRHASLNWPLTTGNLCQLPATFRDARDVALQRQLTETQPAQRELAEVSAR